MSNAYQNLEALFARLAQLDHAVTFLQWDQQVMMPAGGNEARAESIAELVALHHELLSAPRTADLLNEAAAKETEPDRQRSLMEMERVWRQAVCIPSDLVKAKSLSGTICEHGWRTQRQENDWAGFLVNFQEVVRLSREEAQARQAAAPEQFSTPYDALLDLYCTGDDSAFIRQVFDDLKQELPLVLQRVLDRQPEGRADLGGRYPVDDQMALNRKLTTCLGFNFHHGRLDVSTHPFSTGARGDQRITTRFRETDFLEALKATAHETGHASYENGLPEKWDRLPVGRARNMCIHEGQSLLFEKHLYLSRPFTDFFARHVHECLSATRKFNSEAIWVENVRVRPGRIRMEADEVTYPLHVILRFEIESGLIDGTVEAADIPEIWDRKMQQYLGVSTKGNHADGCLQDIHWTDGSFGYFPSYTIGALNAAQLSAAIRRSYPDWQERLQRGDVAFLRNWLDTNVWSQGCRLDSQELIRAATGDGTDPRHFLAHLRARYLDGAY